MDRNKQMLASALSYCNDYGLAVIPIKVGTKKPLIKWEAWKKKKPGPLEITRWWHDHFPGADIAMICGEISNRIVIDIDTYKDKAILEKIDSLTPEQAEYPIVNTPRGGEHRHFAWQPKIPNAALENIDVKSDGGLAMLPPSGINGSQYSWRKGCSIRQITAPFLFNTYVNLIKAGTNKLYNGDKRGLVATNGDKIKDGSRDNTLFHIANCLVKGQMPAQEIQQILTLIGFYGCETPFSQKEIQAKVISALNRSDGVNRAWQEEVEKLLRGQSGNVTTTNLHQWLQAGTRAEKQAINKALYRLADKNILKKSESRAGQYRIINQKAEPLDWKHAKIETYPVVLPLGMHEAIRIMPGTILAFGGVTSTGKTAFAMNIAAINQSQHKIYYYTSEIIKELFKERAVDYDDDWLDWNVELMEIPSPSDLPDVIKPDEFNIIDYIEPPEGDHALMTNIMAGIHNNLKSGIAVVFVQKKSDGFVAGGEYMKNKPHLFCHIDMVEYPVCKLTIIKNKIPQHGYRNPVGQTIEFKIGRDGIGIVPFGKFDFQRWDE